MIYSSNIRNILCTALVALFAIFSTNAEANTSSDKQWTSLLMKYVSDTGHVSYSKWKQSDTDIERLGTYLHGLSTVDPTTLTTNETLAHYINLYNASIIKLVLEHYPLKSVKDIGGLFSGPWKIKFIPTKEGTISLNHIEHIILREKLKDYRIHVGLVCASTSCPELRNEAYVAARIDTQLAEQEHIFLTDSSKNRVYTGMKGRFIKEHVAFMQLSSIFKWFSEDFGEEKGVIKLVKKHLPDKNKKNIEQLIHKNKTDVSYLKYDWSLNGD